MGMEVVSPRGPGCAKAHKSKTNGAEPHSPQNRWQREAKHDVADKLSRHEIQGGTPGRNVRKIPKENILRRIRTAMGNRQKEKQPLTETNKALKRNRYRPAVVGGWRPSWKKTK